MHSMPRILNIIARPIIVNGYYIIIIKQQANWRQYEKDSALQKKMQCCKKYWGGAKN
jgi:hypothetical protein